MSPALLPKPVPAAEAPEDDVQLSLRDHLIELRKRLKWSLIWLMVSAQPIGELSIDGPPYRAVVTFIDISAEVMAEGQNARQRVMLRQAELLNQKILVLVRTAQDAARTGDLERTRLLLARVQRGALHTVTRLGRAASSDASRDAATGLRPAIRVTATSSVAVPRNGR